jgi:mannosyltransferase OCH1-like enzyme
MTAIPEIIHYCWFGGSPLPPAAVKCIASWQKYLPEHTIIEWNESNYDINKNNYITAAYKAKKFAFTSDYARFDILYQYGGVYFDTDVEVIKSFDRILCAGPFFGMETAGRINPGLGCAAAKGQPVIKTIIDHYNNLTFNNDNTTIVDYTTAIFNELGLKKNDTVQQISGITIYPAAYFNPVDFDTHYLKITEETCSIHYGAASWSDNAGKIGAVIHIWLCRIFGKKIGKFISKFVKKTGRKLYGFIKRKGKQ